MQLIQEIIGSTAIVVGTIGSLLIALSITSIKLMIARAEQREAILLAAEQSEQTREAMHQLQQTLGSIHAQVWYLDTQARVVSYNHLAEQFLGMDPLQVRGRPMTALLPSWHEPHQAQSRNEQVLLTGQAMLGTLESFDCEGGICWMNVDRLPSYNAQGLLDGMRVFLYDVTPLKNVERALRFQKSILEAQTETSLDAIVVLSPQNNWLTINHRFRELWNLPNDFEVAASDSYVYRFMSEQLTEPEALQHWLILFDNVPSMQASNLFRLVDGRILDWYSAPILGDDDQLNGRVWYFRDVTVTRKTEQALRDSESRNRALVNSIPDLLFRVRGDGTFIDYHGATGYTPAVEPEHFLGRNIAEVFEAETANRFTEKLQIALRTSEMQIHEYDMKMLDGTMRSWEQRIVVSGEDELLIIIRDISARKHVEEALRQAHTELERHVNKRTAELRKANEQLQQEVEERYRVEEALRSSEERLEMALRGADVGLIDIDLQTGKAIYNERWTEVTGSPSGQYFDTLQSWKNSIHPDDRPIVTSALESHLQGETPFLEQEYRVKRGDETWRWVRCRGKVVHRDTDGLPLRFSGTQMDITEYKQLEQQLQHAQKMDAVGRLAGGVAHDFNNILTVIMSYSELVLLQTKGNTRLRTRVEEIKKAAEKAARLTRQLLMFSRSETVAPRLLDMNRLVVDIESMLERLIGEHIILHIHLDPTINAIKADAGQIEQILLNLVVNSRDAMPEGGTLDVTTRRVEYERGQLLPYPNMQSGTYVELSVEDTGCGMTPDVQKRIFEPFFTTKGPGKGTGLGLSTVFSIVKQNRGFIGVESEVGEGTLFRILFPAATESALAATVQAPPPPIERKNGIETILLVEDETQIRNLIGASLTNAGYTVLAAGNSDEALAINEHHKGPIHLIIMDVVLPGSNGVKLSEQLMAQRPSTKLLYISGYTDSEINIRQSNNEYQSFLRKPFTPAILAGTVRKLLDNELVKQ